MCLVVRLCSCIVIQPFVLCLQVNLPICSVRFSSALGQQSTSLFLLHKICPPPFRLWILSPHWECSPFPHLTHHNCAVQPHLTQPPFLPSLPPDFPTCPKRHSSISYWGTMWPGPSCRCALASERIVSSFLLVNLWFDTMGKRFVPRVRHD